MSGTERSTEALTAVTECRDLARSSAVTRELPARDRAPQSSPDRDPGRRLAAFAGGSVLVIGAVIALHTLYRTGDGAGDLAGWAGLLLLALTALGGGIKLAMWGVRPVTAAVSDEAKARLSEPVLAIVASGAVIVGALGMWWTFRGGYAIWWQHLTGESRWSLSLGVGQMLTAVLAGAALFTGGRYVTGLAKEALTDSGLFIERDRAGGRRRAPEGLWHPGLVAALIGGGLGLVLLTVGITPRLYVWITGPDVLPAVGAIAAVLLWAIGSNLGWWKGLVGLYKWATDASQKATATAGVVAVLMFSASGLGLGWFTPATVPQAHAACPPDCGGPGGSDGPPGGGQMFQPPSQGGPQMPDYQGGINQPPMDQNGSISIYNTQAPSVGNSTGSQGAQQGPQQGWDQPAHGTQPPDYQNATPYTQGPGRPNPDFNPGSQGAQTSPGNNAGSQGGQSNQGVQQPAQEPQQATQNQPPQQDTGEQPDQQPQQSDQQKIDDLTRQLQEKQQQSGQDRQRLDDLTKQLQQNKQNQKQQQSTKFPSKDKKKDDKDEQDDRDDQSQNTDLASLLLGAASTRRRKQDEQEQGPDTQALGQDASQAVQGLPGDVQTYVQSGQQIGESSGQAAQGFGSAAQAGASLASSAQSGAVNPQDAITVVQGVSQGIQGTADAVNAGSQIVKTAQGEADQVAQAVGDANPQLKPQTEQFTQLNDQASQVTDMVGQGAELTSQASGAVNSVSSMGSGGAPTDAAGESDPLSGTATAVDHETPTPKPGDPPNPKDPNPNYPNRNNDGTYRGGNDGRDGKLEEKLALDKREAQTRIPITRDQVRATVPGATNPDGSEQWRYYDGLEPTGRTGEYLGLEAKGDGGVRTGPQKSFDRLVTPENPARATLNGEPIRIVGTQLLYPELNSGGGGVPAEAGPGRGGAAPAPAAPRPPAPAPVQPGEGGLRFGGFGGTLIGPPEESSMPGHGLEVYPADPSISGGSTVSEIDGQHHG
ncbi:MULTISPECIES: methyl-accepting chemotaxis protein [unclassified Mycobacterium]|uniref:methyl-accepting chemotaxis protein n=1 Tax=unclassified Mycobacterium TaxID=2642494 RepID=UPI00256FD633|nr:MULTISPECIES: methyl-accepting chemotaxis protein [unclassified Mycobacterium]